MSSAIITIIIIIIIIIVTIIVVIWLIFQSSLPAIFPTAALFDTGPSVTTETPVEETEKPKQSKKDKRKERHDNFLKSKLIQTSVLASLHQSDMKLCKEDCWNIGVNHFNLNMKSFKFNV